ncbi:MAG: polysaccharide pyruvyl transferase family protein [Sutterellaceae bacterium]|nr:polysaccharide pyruvyl transferase family protein [Sutterellaceae bacterium]MDY2868868.1 polysaccharide pyruvyl transferase family protein [Mesosutterella sp.]
MTTPIPLYYCKGLENFGDELSTYIVEKISKRPIVYAAATDNGKFVAVGSILSYDVLHSDSLIWGTGTISKSACNFLPKIFPLTRSFPTFIRRLKNTNEKTATVLAVRGPLTRRALLNEGIQCPEIYGDPAIVLPRLYRPNPMKTGKTGLILHYSQESLITKEMLSGIEKKQIKLISIHRNGIKQIEAFIDEVCSCEKIFSTSLHGLIIAQAYGIPAQWIELNGIPIHRNATHKFNDYFLGVGAKPQSPYFINFRLDGITDLYKMPVKNSFLISKASIDDIFSAFPFKSIST